MKQMMDNDLVRRYIYAVVCNLPAKAQPDVEKELEGMIAELLDARLKGAEAAEGDVSAVLTELGSPEELAVKYCGEENNALISGIYFLWFKKALKLVLPIAAAGVAFATLLASFVKWQPSQAAGEYYPEFVANALAGGVDAAITATVCIGLIFVILERKRVNLKSGDFLSKLPPVPDRRARIKIHEPILNVLWHVAVAVMFLGFPYLIGVYFDSYGWMPVFDEAYIGAYWYLVIIWAGFGIAREIVKLTERRYSKRLAWVTAVAHMFTGTSAAFFFADNRIMNHVFVSNVRSMVRGVAADEVGQALGHVNIIILAMMLLALLMDLAVTTYRAIRYDVPSR